MKQSIIIIILFNIINISCLAITAPTPKIYIIDDAGKLITAPGVSANAPYQIHVSALPEMKTSNCFWDPVQWRADGEHNLCSDAGALSQKNLPASAALKYFSNDASKLKNPQNVDTSVPYACFETYGLTLDAATQNLINIMTKCEHDRDVAQNAEISAQLLGGGDVLKSKYEWDFGDPGSPYNQVKGFNAAHIYDQPTSRSRVIKLTVTNEAGLVGTASITVSVEAGKRLPVLINSDADVVAKLNVSQGVPQGRRITFKSGATFHIPWSISLFTNDRVTTDGAAKAILIPANNSVVFSSHASSHVLVENLDIEGVNHQGWIANSYGSSVAYRNIIFQNIQGGFQGTSAGLLIQNVGMPHAADGSWQSNHIVANFILHSVKGLSLYGNRAYLLQTDANREPAIRSNGGYLLSILDNDIGGYTGKNDQVSFRGPKNIYFSGNRMRGGVVNVQIGTSPNPQPAAMPNNLVLEGNNLQNVSFEVSGGVPNVLLRNNLMHVHADSETAYNSLYPLPGVQLSMSTGPSYGMLTNHIRLEKNAFQFDRPSIGRLLVFWGGHPESFESVGNRFLSPSKLPYSFNSSLQGITQMNGNSYYLNPGITIADMGLAANSLAHWNANALQRGKVNDLLLDLPAKAPMSGGELVLP